MLVSLIRETVTPGGTLSEKDIRVVMDDAAKLRMSTTKTQNDYIERMVRRGDLEFTEEGMYRVLPDGQRQLVEVGLCTL
jgi:hypothetical protein